MKRRKFIVGGTGAFLAVGGGESILNGLDRNLSNHLGAASAQTSSVVTSNIQEMVMGSSDAPVQITEYASYTCPHCASFHADQLEALKTNYISNGKARLIYREVYFDRPGLWASMIARYPGDQDFFFAFSDLVFQKQSEWLASGDPSVIIQELRSLAKVGGLDDPALDACLSDGSKAQNLVAWYEANAAADQINVAPSFIVAGQKYSNMSYDDFSEALDARLN